MCFILRRNDRIFLKGLGEEKVFTDNKLVLISFNIIFKVMINWPSFFYNPFSSLPNQMPFYAMPSFITVGNTFSPM
jgi:hypothetical protein